MKKYAVCGCPILHSLSPQVFRQLFEKNNFDACYSRILTDSADEAMLLYKKLGLQGLNITSPLKNDIIRHCSSCTDDAKQIVAVNTIVSFKEQLLGFNTDWEGVLNALRLAYVEIIDDRVLIIGAGSAASAAIFGIRQFHPNANITIINRNENKARLLAEKFDTKWIPYASNTGSYDVIISTIPTDKMSHYRFNDNAILLMADYSHNLTCFSEKHKLIDGVQWLVNQAIPAFEYYLGDDVFCRKIDIADEIIQQHNTKLNHGNAYLTGFSGAGKSGIGKRIAEKLGREFIDIDILVEERIGKSIATIFKNEGELAFRKYEAEVLDRVCLSKQCVVALGGGLLNYPIDGIVAYLYSDLESSLGRIDTTSRPMLNGKSVSEIEKLYNERKEQYFAASDVIVSTESADLLIPSLSRRF